MNAVLSTIISCAIVAAIPSAYIYAQKPDYHIHAIYIVSFAVILALFLVSFLFRRVINHIFDAKLSVSIVNFVTFGCAALLVLNAMQSARSNIIGVTFSAFGVAVLGTIAGALFAIVVRRKKPA